MFENPRRGRQARNFTTNVPKILVFKSSSEQIFSRKLPLGAPGKCIHFQDFIRIAELAVRKFCLVRSSVFFYQSFIDVRVVLSNFVRNI